MTEREKAGTEQNSSAASGQSFSRAQIGTRLFGSDHYDASSVHYKDETESLPERSPVSGEYPHKQALEAAFGLSLNGLSLAASSSALGQDVIRKGKVAGYSGGQAFLTSTDKDTAAHEAVHFWQGQLHGESRGTFAKWSSSSNKRDAAQTMRAEREAYNLAGRFAAGESDLRGSIQEPLPNVVHYKGPGGPSYLNGFHRMYILWGPWVNSKTGSVYRNRNQRRRYSKRLKRRNQRRRARRDRARAKDQQATDVAARKRFSQVSSKKRHRRSFMEFLENIADGLAGAFGFVGDILSSDGKASSLEISEEQFRNLVIAALPDELAGDEEIVDGFIQYLEEEEGISPSSDPNAIVQYIDDRLDAIGEEEEAESGNDTGQDESGEAIDEAWINPAVTKRADVDRGWSPESEEVMESPQEELLASTEVMLLDAANDPFKVSPVGGWSAPENSPDVYSYAVSKVDGGAPLERMFIFNWQTYAHMVEDGDDVEGLTNVIDLANNIIVNDFGVQKEIKFNVYRLRESAQRGFFFVHFDAADYDRWEMTRAPGRRGYGKNSQTGIRRNPFALELVSEAGMPARLQQEGISTSTGRATYQIDRETNDEGMYSPKSEPEMLFERLVLANVNTIIEDMRSGLEGSAAALKGEDDAGRWEELKSICFADAGLEYELFKREQELFSYITTGYTGSFSYDQSKWLEQVEPIWTQMAQLRTTYPELMMLRGPVPHGTVIMGAPFKSSYGGRVHKFDGDKGWLEDTKPKGLDESPEQLKQVVAQNTGKFDAAIEEFSVKVNNGDIPLYVLTGAVQRTCEQLGLPSYQGDPQNYQPNEHSALSLAAARWLRRQQKSHGELSWVLTGLGFALMLACIFATGGLATLAFGVAGAALGFYEAGLEFDKADDLTVSVQASQLDTSGSPLVTEPRETLEQARQAQVLGAINVAFAITDLGEIAKGSKLAGEELVTFWKRLRRARQIRQVDLSQYENATEKIRQTIQRAMRQSGDTGEDTLTELARWAKSDTPSDELYGIARTLEVRASSSAGRQGEIDVLLENVPHSKLGDFWDAAAEQGATVEQAFTSLFSNFRYAMRKGKGSTGNKPYWKSPTETEIQNNAWSSEPMTTDDITAEALVGLERARTKIENRHPAGFRMLPDRRLSRAQRIAKERERFEGFATFFKSWFQDTGALKLPNGRVVEAKGYYLQGSSLVRNDPQDLDIAIIVSPEDFIALAQKMIAQKPTMRKYIRDRMLELKMIQRFEMNAPGTPVLDVHNETVNVYYNQWLKGGPVYGEDRMWSDQIGLKTVDFSIMSEDCQFLSDLMLEL